DATVDACFAVTPEMLGLTGGLTRQGTGADGSVKGAHVVASTAYMTRSVADVYACRKDFFDANRELVEKFAAGYLKACEQLVDLRTKAKKHKDAAGYRKVLKMTQDVFGKGELPTEQDADDLIADAVFVGLPGNKEFFEAKGNLSGFDARQKD